MSQNLAGCSKQRRPPAWLHAYVTRVALPSQSQCAVKRRTRLRSSGIRAFLGLARDHAC
jgi:hypothetical protein